MKNIQTLFVVTVLLIFSSCGAKKAFVRNSGELNVKESQLSHDNIDYELYLVGDIGASQSKVYNSKIVDLIKSELRPNSKTQSVVFLGNSFSENGLPDTESPEFSMIDKSIEEYIAKLKDNTDKVYFIPGNNEWFNGHNYTTSSVHHVEEYVQSKANDKNIFVPSNGCGEPKVVELTDDLVLLLMDSQWLLQGDNSDERKRSGCEIDDELELVTFLQEILSKNKNKNVILAAHHPIYSNGKTGGNYGASSHLLPLPILGSLFTGIKKIGGGSQKFGHPQYEAYRSAIKLALGNFEGVIHASAHDQNMQYFAKNSNHFVVAGSGANVEFVRKGGDADFAFMNKGFAKITHTKNLELWLEFYIPDPSNNKSAISIYKKLLYKKEIIDYSDKTIYPDLENYPETVKTQASKAYVKGKVGMGKTYRAEWGVEVEAPVLLLDQFEGGLTPVQQGGGFQTKSLRLQNSKGRQWVIRSIDKEVTKIVPPALRNTFIRSFVQDGISAAHPYAAFAIPQLAEAAQIYHANPKFVWLPHQKALGDYNLQFSNRLYLFEERPGGVMTGHPTYGGASKSVNTPELVEKLFKNNKHIVDQKYVLRARLFDLLIGDWDRHDDQWRWGIYEEDATPDKKVYRAIPRDRDQAFFKNDGFLNYISSRPFFNPALRKFENEIDIISGLAYNARHFDRHFLSQMNEEDFVATAKFLQSQISDQVIEEALSSWPKDVYDLSGEEIMNKLKSRRNDLVEYSQKFYKYLTKEVTVIGTNGSNIFEVTAMKDNFLLVNAYHEEKKPENLIWSRQINGDHCEQLWIYGLKKHDEFNFYGDEKSSIKVKLVGGSGNDVVNNESRHIDVRAYDRKDGMELKGAKVKSRLSNEKGVNHFDRLDWKLDRTIHFPMITFYTDEGVGLSYNIWWQKNGFRKNPYKSKHTLSLAYFGANSAIVADYSGLWPMAFGRTWDFKLDAAATGPSFTQFFYGLGNEYVNYEETLPNVAEAGSTSYFIVRGKHLDINTYFEKNLGNNRAFSINPSVEYFNLDDELNDPNEPRFIFSEQANRTSSDFDSKVYVGLGLNYSSKRVNNPVLPTRGYIFTTELDYKLSLSDSEFSNLTFGSNIAAYIPFSPKHNVVLATNIGGAYTLGGYEFFHANYLSSQSRLRGYKTNRFGGDGIVYHATDLRIKLFQGSGGLRTGIGVFASFDYGRSFLEDEDVSGWHTSYGGGLYLTPLNMIGFKIGYYIGDGDSQMTIGGALSY